MTYRVAELVADCLVAHGVDRAFGVPGESFLALLDALRDRNDFDLVTCRHEGSASLAAVADAKLTGRAGVVMTSRGPGAFNAALGLHVAAQEAIPLVMLVGQVDRPNLARDAVQEIDCGRSFDGVLKWSVRLNSADLVPEMMARAFAVAHAGTPGPVAIELPEDLLEDPAKGIVATANGAVRPEPGAAAIEQARAALTASERPILLVGGECRAASFRQDLIAFSEKWNVPVVTMNKMQDQFPNSHPLWAGQFGFFTSQPHVKLLERADLVVAVGTRLGDLSSLGFAFPRQAEPRQPLVHVYPDPDAIGKRVRTDVAVVSGSHAFVSAMLAAPATARACAEWSSAAAAARTATHGWPQFGVPSADVFGHAVAAIAAHFRPDGIVTTDSGNFAGWVHRIFSLEPTARLLGSACGAMGSGVPSGLAASLRFPERQVVAFCGDGGFLMTGNELATAVARGANLTIVVSNNQSYGTIRSHQERAFPDRPYGTDLSNPDFAALARAFGAKGFIIEDAESAPSTVAEAMTTKGPVVIEVRSDVRQTLDKSLAASR
ncbi:MULTISPECIES: thiamine pyrophosphate-dependent enzyme [unclassified Bradyrhizobium]|uniref:thiamine pyrophosphate-dependent enzyme n=1 Tax=unclassified Bradyrhizobium TaxID=2631580 RepID=UPI001FF7D469|nr:MULTISPECIES: thiamine pyrophosphate-dependent enzyme [unclassified Bradyrhizobium]MCK1588575.1 decarboxylase [Bradyrhizobium sp. 169]UPJ31712.1 decarboxylase [Bradyrhizobium sp. CW1]